MRAQDFPTRELLVELHPAVVSLIPDDYAGEISNSHLAYAVGKALTNGISYDSILNETFELPGFLEIDNAKKYADLIFRLGANKDNIFTYYDLTSIFEHNYLTDEEIFFGLALTLRYETSPAITGAISTFRAIYEYQTGYLERKPEQIVLPMIADFDNLTALGRILRSEGIIMPQANLWVASSHWTAQEVLLMLEEGLNLEKAMELYMLGFTTMEEIITYGEILPETWLNRIFKGPPKVE